MNSSSGYGFHAKLKGQRFQLPAQSNPESNESNMIKFIIHPFVIFFLPFVSLLTGRHKKTAFDIFIFQCLAYKKLSTTLVFAALGFTVPRPPMGPRPFLPPKKCKNGSKQTCSHRNSQHLPQWSRKK